MGQNCGYGSRRRARWLFAAAAVCLFLSGCGRENLSDPYSYEGSAFTVSGILEKQEGEPSDGYEPLFAADLCVVGEEDPALAGEIDAEAGCIFDLTRKQTLYSKNAYEKLYPASVTKIMTALLAVKYGNLQDVVTVTEDAVITESGASLCGIKPGDRLTLEQLLYGLMLPSGNDAGAAVAVHMAGSVEAFAEMMNREAQALGATGTHFVNPHGLTDEEHYTTAYDLYLILNEALKFPEFRAVASAVSYEASYQNGNGDPVTVTWESSNQYLTGRKEAPEGVTVILGKTGTTQAAKNCLIIAARDDQTGDEYISVVLKADGRDTLYRCMTDLMEKIPNS